MSQQIRIIMQFFNFQPPPYFGAVRKALKMSLRGAKRRSNPPVLCSERGDCFVPIFITSKQKGKIGTRNDNLLRNPVSKFFITNESGFSLIETIMVIIFLGVALVATMDMMSSSMSQSVDIEIINTATNLATEKLERVFADKKTKGYDYVKQSNYQSETNANGFTGFNRYVTITNQNNSKEVKVKVTHSNIPDCIVTAFLTNY